MPPPLLPVPSVRRPLLRFAAGTWAILRLVLMALSALAGDTLLWGPWISLGLCLLVATLAVVDLTVLRERVFLANVGISRRAVAGLTLGVAGLLEVAASVGLRLLLGP